MGIIQMNEGAFCFNLTVEMKLYFPAFAPGATLKNVDLYS